MIYIYIYIYIYQVSWTLRRLGLPLPLIAASDVFLNVALVAALFRSAGAFFIRRGGALSTDPLWAAVLQVTPIPHHPTPHPQHTHTIAHHHHPYHRHRPYTPTSSVQLCPIHCSPPGFKGLS
jgi:hypothetical protein